MTIPLRGSVIEIDNAIAGEEAAHKHRIAVPEPWRASWPIWRAEQPERKRQGACVPPEQQAPCPKRFTSREALSPPRGRLRPPTADC